MYLYVYIYMIAYSMRRELQSTHIVVDHRIVAIFHILHVCRATNRLVSVSPAFPAGRDTAGAPRQRAGDFFVFLTVNGQHIRQQKHAFWSWMRTESRMSFAIDLVSITGLLLRLKPDIPFAYWFSVHVMSNGNKIWIWIYLNPIYNPQPSAKKHLESPVKTLRGATTE